MEHSGQYIHLWAIVPPPDVAQQIDDLRKEFSVSFQCFKALKPPVHLTLYAPFKSTIADAETLLESLRDWVGQQQSFGLELRNFAFFEHPKTPVIYIDVLMNPVLKALNAGISHQTQKLLAPNDTGKQRFHPHFTIGYRDISPAIFPKVKHAYSQRLFQAMFMVGHVCLFRHNRVKWELKHELPLLGEVINQGSLFA